MTFTIEEDDFRNYLIYLVNEGKYGIETINNRNGSIRFFLTVIMGKNINYMRTARIRRSLKLPDIWSKEEVEQFLSAVDDPRYQAIFVNVYGSGLRVSEICKLKIKDIDSKNMRLFICQAKGKKDRYTILSQRGLNALRHYWKIYRPVNPQNYLFPSTSKEGYILPSTVEQAFRKYKKKAGITKAGNVHMLRHCFATHTLEDGTDVIYIKQLLGHSCFSSTDRYLHVAKTSVYKTKSPVDSLR